MDLRTLSLAALAVFAPLPAQASSLSGDEVSQGSHICLKADHIRGRTIVDNSTIVFSMSDGTYWKNTLQKPCRGLALLDRFDFATHDSYICADGQSIHVLGEGTRCDLGGFEQTNAPRSEP